MDLEKIEWSIHILMLGACAWQDWKEKKVALWKIAVYAGMIVVFWGLKIRSGQAASYLFQTLAGAGPGLFLLLAGKCSGEAVGYGDGLLALILGISLGFWRILGILSAAFFGVFCTAVVLYWRRGGKKGMELPFVPFLLAGTLGAVIS